MAEFYVAKSQTVTLLSTGRPFRLRRGIHNIPDELADRGAHPDEKLRALHPSANELGIKPLHEMTDKEWILSGRRKPVVVAAALVVEAGASEAD